MSDIDPEYARVLREQAETREQLAHARGKLEATLEAWALEPEHAELLRMLAWERAGHTFRSSAGKFINAREGWPEGVDRDGFVAGWVREHMAMYADPKTPVSAEASPAVKAFRKALSPA